MTDEERDIITRFIQRVSGALPGASGGFAPALPPVDPAADKLIGDLFAHYPEARYRLTQTAFVQEAAVKEAQARIQSLETELQTTRDALRTAQAAQLAAAQATPAQRSSFFAGGVPVPAGQPVMRPAAPAPNPWGQAPTAPSYPQQPATYAPPQPQYAPPPMAAAPQAGSGFLGSALKTAAGVAGGVVAGNALMGLFSGHGGGIAGGLGGGFGPSGQPVSETVINNYGDAAYQGGGFQPADPNYTPWGEPPEVSGSQALNDGYWSKDSMYQPEMGGPEPAVAENATYVPDTTPDFSDDSDLA